MAAEEPIIGGDIIESGNTSFTDATGKHKTGLHKGNVPKERIMNADSLHVQRFQAKTVSTVLNNLEKWLETNTTIEIISTDIIDYRDAVTYIVIYRGIARSW